MYRVGGNSLQKASRPTRDTLMDRDWECDFLNFWIATCSPDATQREDFYIPDWEGSELVG